MFNDKEFDREIDCLKAHLGIFAYELEKSGNVLEFIKNNEPYRLQINKPDKGYIVDIRISRFPNEQDIQTIERKMLERRKGISAEVLVGGLYKKYISLAKKSSEDNVLSPLDFAGSARKIFERNSIIAKLEVLQEILGYSYEKIKHDIERAE